MYNSEAKSWSFCYPSNLIFSEYMATLDFYSLFPVVPVFLRLLQEKGSKNGYEMIGKINDFLYIVLIYEIAHKFWN